ncbi:MAG: hypothetical protein ACKVHO_07335, partial [Verrucomicrobiia bacterium]
MAENTPRIAVHRCSRRVALRTAAGSCAILSSALAAAPRKASRARIAITFDLEMSRNFPTWEQT